MKNPTTPQAVRPPRPAAPKVIAANIPPELTQRHQWVVWGYQPNRDGTKWTKVPYSHISGAAEMSPASSTDPTTWLPFNVTYAVYLFHRLDGVGYVLSESDPYSAFDLDHVGEWPAEKRDLIVRLASLGFYAERTPSLDGLRVWVRGRLPVGVRHKRTFPGTHACLEVYDRSRFLTVTGHVWRPQ